MSRAVLARGARARRGSRGWRGVPADTRCVRRVGARQRAGRGAGGVAAARALRPARPATLPAHARRARRRPGPVTATRRPQTAPVRNISGGSRFRLRLKASENSFEILKLGLRKSMRMTVFSNVGIMWASYPTPSVSVYILTYLTVSD